MQDVRWHLKPEVNLRRAVLVNKDFPTDRAVEHAVAIVGQLVNHLTAPTLHEDALSGMTKLCSRVRTRLGDPSCSNTYRDGRRANVDTARSPSALKMPSRPRSFRTSFAFLAVQAVWDQVLLGDEAMNPSVGPDEWELFSEEAFFFTKTRGRVRLQIVGWRSTFSARPAYPSRAW